MNSETKNSVSKSKTSFDVVSAIDSMATNVRRERQSAEELLNFDKQKKDIRERIIAAAKVRGEEFTEDDVSKATDLYFERQYEFVEPSRNFQTKLAEAYVDRRRLGRKYGIPSLISLVAAGAIWATVLTGKNLALNVAESRVEREVVTAYQKASEFSIETEKAEKMLDVKNVPTVDKNEARSLFNETRVRIATTDEFFSKFCRNGDAKTSVTRENYSQAETEIENVNTALNQASPSLQKGKAIIELQDKLDSSKQGLEALIAQVKNNNPPKVLSDRAETAYQNGLANIKGRNIDAVKINVNELTSVISDVKQFAVLPEQESKIYSAIQAVLARDELEGKQEADKLHAEAQTYIANVDIQGLMNVINNLNALNTTLNQEYQIVTVYGDRRQPDDDDSIVRYYYLNEDKDKNGNTIPRVITHEETKQKVTVNKWGYRVGQIKLQFGETPQTIKDEGKEPEAYKRLVADIKDNGIVDNDDFGEKKRGYLHEKITMSGIPLNSGEYPYD